MAAWFASPVVAAELLPIEQEVAAATKSDRVTIVHFWAPWCSNCKAELASGGWRDFIAANPNVQFIFITIWNGGQGDGRGLLEQHGVRAQRNVQLLLHPNGSRRREERMATFLGMPVSWIPTTWVYRTGELRFALNYGEVRFPVLQQLVADASDAWKH